MTTEVAAGESGGDLTFPVPRRCPFGPPAEHERLRDIAPISEVRMTGGGHAWWVSNHEDGRAILVDPRFSSDRRRENFPFADPDPAVRAQFKARPPAMLGMDGAEHVAARRALIGEFTVTRLNALRPRIQEIVDGFVDEMLATDQPVDLVSALSLPVPSLVICELLGVPYADHDFFEEQTHTLVRRSADSQERDRAFGELLTYLGVLIARKQADPGDDLFSRQIARQRHENGEVDHESLVSTAFLLLVAGHETTANMISLGVVALLDHPEQRAAVTADPSRTPLAIEEMLRYFSIVEMETSRVATEDVRIGDVTIAAGDGVVVSGLSANWDPEVFANPAEFDIERGARHHIAFGYGPHQCLGQNLARIELQIVFDTLFRRIPTLRLAVGVDDVAYKNDAGIYGVHELPVTW